VASSSTLSAADPQLQPAVVVHNVFGSFRPDDLSALTGSPVEQLAAGEGAADALPAAGGLLGGAGGDTLRAGAAGAAAEEASSSHWQSPLQLGQGQGQHVYSHHSNYPGYSASYGYPGGYNSYGGSEYSGGYGHSSDSGAASAAYAGYPAYSAPMAAGPGAGASERGFDSVDYYQGSSSYSSHYQAGGDSSYHAFSQPQEALAPPAASVDTAQAVSSEGAGGTGVVARVSDARDLEQQLLAAANAPVQPQGPTAGETGQTWALCPLCRLLASGRTFPRG
jgi:hypothetical protein